MKLDLPRESRHGNTSFASCFTLDKKNNRFKEIRVVACSDGLVLLRLEPDDDEEDMTIRYFIGNPMLPQWIQLPPPPPPPLPREYHPLLQHGCYIDSGLVTRVHNGALLGYKVVRIHSQALHAYNFETWSFEIYSSDTGEWSVKQVLPGPELCGLSRSNTVSLNGKLHWRDISGHIIVHDFFSHDDQLRAIRLPARKQGERYPFSVNPPSKKMIYTTSQGYFVLINVGLMEDVNKSYNVTIWRLKCDTWSWEKAWDINLACLGLGRSCVPVAIHCFDIDIIYLWDLDTKCFLACNLRTNTKSYGARKDGTPPIDSTSQNPLETRRTVYKEDDFCIDPRSYVSPFCSVLARSPGPRYDVVLI
ncbi:unnamed protein product [Thlaspi arvense]|uniref:F-box protein At3g26010-like beta-propeller domain-containing protein n=1 Tax=Thlaspi arvense TaxID=13288 RepID=A0AAU9SHY9_THLAR|nr:unnamed protein product [Thlaspi arvense]